MLGIVNRCENGCELRSQRCDDFEIVANGFVSALVAGTVVRMGVIFEVNGGDNFETIANRFVSVSVVETVANGLGFFLSETLGFRLIDDDFISSYWH